MSELSANAILYVPEEKPFKGVIQIIHGMAEHQGRYRELAQFFSGEGYVVLTSDLRGHGNHIARDVELGYFGDNAIARLVSDVHDNTAYLKEYFPKIPYILFGHGIGALIAVIYIKKYDRSIDGLFLSGMPADHLWPRRGMNLLLRLLMLFRGEFPRSRAINYLIMGQYFRPTVKEGSEFAWLSADRENVRRYEADPRCGYIYTFNGFQTVLDLMDMTYSKGSWIRKSPNLPIRLFWGANDPCVGDSNELQKTISLFSDAGYQNVFYITYPGQRHEIFRDKRKDEVCHDALIQLEAIRAAKSGRKPVKAAKKKRHIVLDNFVDPEVDKPLEKDEKLNLKEFIDAHNQAAESEEHIVRPKVEMIDFAEIDDMREEAEAVSVAAETVSAAEVVPAAVPAQNAGKSVQGDTAADDDDMDFDALIDELLNSETYVPEKERRPLDQFDGFKIDPEIMDGIH